MYYHTRTYKERTITFLRGREGGLNNFQFPCTAKTAKKIVQGESWGKIERVVCTIHVLCSTLKRFLHKLLLSKNIYTSCPTYRWKKHFMPPKNTDPSDSLKKLMVPPLKVISKDNPASRQRRRYNDNFATFQREHFDREMGPHQTETNLVDVLM